MYKLTKLTETASSDITPGFYLVGHWASGRSTFDWNVYECIEPKEIHYGVTGQPGLWKNKQGDRAFVDGQHDVFIPLPEEPNWENYE